MTLCWACEAPVRSARCGYCSAPEWSGRVTRVDDDGPGVYIAESDCGLFKIGYSGLDVGGRVCAVAYEGRHNATITARAYLPGASRDVELWLHHAFAETRDRRWADAEALPFPTEWFWPTPALRALIAGEAFVDLLAPELIA